MTHGTLIVAMALGYTQEVVLKIIGARLSKVGLDYY